MTPLLPDDSPAACHLSRLRVQVLLALASEKRALEGCLVTVATWQQRLADDLPLHELYDNGDDDDDDD